VSLRAVNYIPLNLQLAEEVKGCSRKWKTLAEVTEPGTLRRGLRFKRIDADPEFGVELIGQREGFNLVPKGRWIAKSFLPNDKLLFVPDGTIVVASQEDFMNQTHLLDANSSQEKHSDMFTLSIF